VSFGEGRDDGWCAANQPVTLTNVGTASLKIASITIKGPQAADFSETNTCGKIPATLAARASCTITVVFKPRSEEWATATLVITDNSHGVAGPTQTVDLIQWLRERRR
jgi:hypothetical protein